MVRSWTLGGCEDEGGLDMRGWKRAERLLTLAHVALKLALRSCGPLLLPPTSSLPFPLPSSLPLRSGAWIWRTRPRCCWTSTACCDTTARPGSCRWERRPAPPAVAAPPVAAPHPATSLRLREPVRLAPLHPCPCHRRPLRPPPQPLALHALTVTLLSVPPIRPPRSHPPPDHGPGPHRLALLRLLHHHRALQRGAEAHVHGHRAAAALLHGRGVPVREGRV